MPNKSAFSPAAKLARAATKAAQAETMRAERIANAIDGAETMPETTDDTIAAIAGAGVTLPDTVTPPPVATDGQSDAPAPNSPAPADVIASARARRLAQAQAHIAAGAHKPNVRTTTDVRISIGVAKYDFSHLAKLAFAKRISGLPPASQAFYLTNAHLRDVPAAQLDNAKLARVLSAGLATSTGGTRDGQHLCGPVRVSFRSEADIAAEIAAAKA